MPLVLFLALLAACSDSSTGPGPVGPPAGLSVVAGAEQQGTVGAAVPIRPSVRVRDAEGRGVAGISVRFDVLSGGGAVTGDSVVTDAEGVATVGEWRLGPLPVANTLRAQTLDFPLATSVTATAGVGAPSSIQVVTGGANLAAVVGEEVLPRPTVRVRDAFGNPIPGASVTWQVAAGGGTLTGSATSTTDAEGRATVSGWRLGPSSGTNQLRARTANGILAAFSALGIGVPAAIAPTSPASQSGFINFAVPLTARVRVTDASNANVAGVPVVFKVTSGTGSIIGDTVVTDLNGIAALGDWAMGASGFSEVTATVPGFAGGAAVFTATGVARPFTIEVRFLSTPPPDLRDAFIAAAQRWMEVIVGDLPDFPLNQPTSWNCFAGLTLPPIVETVDDVIIYAKIGPIDGPSNVLAQANNCLERAGNKLTVIGGMEFDIDDSNTLLNSGRFTSVVAHEMGHVLGLTRERYRDLGLATALGSLDPFFTGNSALAAWPSLGITYSGNLIPLHNEDGGGSADHHWRESVLGDELMTPFIAGSGVAMPLSAITVGAMADLGYLVNPASADQFAAALRAERPTGGDILLKEIIHRPKWQPASGGRIVPID